MKASKYENGGMCVLGVCIVSERRSDGREMKEKKKEERKRNYC